MTCVPVRVSEFGIISRNYTDFRENKYFSTFSTHFERSKILKISVKFSTFSASLRQILNIFWVIFDLNGHIMDRNVSKVSKIDSYFWHFRHMSKIPVYFPPYVESFSSFSWLSQNFRPSKIAVLYRTCFDRQKSDNVEIPGKLKARKFPANTWHGLTKCKCSKTHQPILKCKHQRFVYFSV